MAGWPCVQLDEPRPRCPSCELQEWIVETGTAAAGGNIPAETRPNADCKCFQSRTQDSDSNLGRVFPTFFAKSANRRIGNYIVQDAESARSDSPRPGTSFGDHPSHDPTLPGDLIVTGTMDNGDGMRQKTSQGIERVDRSAGAAGQIQ